MITFPNAKINLGLHIVAKRPDGYHDIETILYPVGWSDCLEIIPALPGAAPFNFAVQDADLGDVKNNLCYKAYYLLKEEFNLPAVECYLQKAIPFGAGLGGGSSDGAFVLKMLNDIFKLDIKENRLQEYASRLGSDCAFFIYNQPAIARGRGNEISSINISLADYYLVIVMPEVKVSTADAYSKVKPAIPAYNLEDIVTLPHTQWRSVLKNDFEDSVFELYPQIKAIKDKLYSYGAIYASMSGSGSSVFGIFKEVREFNSVFPGLRIWSGKAGF